MSLWKKISEVWGLQRSLKVSLGCCAYFLCVLCLCSQLLSVFQSVGRWVSQSVCGSGCPGATQQSRSGPEPSSGPCRSGRIMLRWSPSIVRWLLGKTKPNQTPHSCVCASKKPSLRGEMSAVSPEQVQTGEPSRTGAEADPQKAGILQPQTVFVILDSSETLNLVRWVRKLGKVPLITATPNSIQKSVLSNPAALVSPSLTWNPRNRLSMLTRWAHSVIYHRIWL